MVETQGNPWLSITPRQTMERTIDFDGVTSYDLNLAGSNMVLKLVQGDTVTNIKIETANKVLNQIKSREPSKIQPRKVRTSGSTKMTENAVREIRTTWDSIVQACGTKSAAAEKLAKIYNCSAKNIYAIIYKYSWAHVQ